MFRMKNMRVGFKPQNGITFLVRASVSLYEPRGDYQLIIETMHPAGEGLLQQQFEQLKMKLAAEGLLRKIWKKIYRTLQSGGNYYLKTGAALQDILHILQRRDPSLKVVIYPTAVQRQWSGGGDCADDCHCECAQGSGCLNCRAAAVRWRICGVLTRKWWHVLFLLPICRLCAVGHETDVTIADFVADLRASTPSA